MKKNKKGFTLIELLAVIAILGILIVLAVPKVIKYYNNSKKKAFVIEAQTVLKSAEVEALKGRTGVIEAEELNIKLKKGYEAKVYIPPETRTNIKTFKVSITNGNEKIEGKTLGELETEGIEAIEEGKILYEVVFYDATPLESFTYAIGTYDRWEDGSDIWDIDEGYILLTRYTGSSTTVNIPTTYETEGITYNTLTFYDFYYDGGTFFGNQNIEYVNFSEGVETAYWDDEWIYDSISGFFDSCMFLKRVTGIPNSVTNMEGTFNNCTSLESAPVIPNTVTNMIYTFYGCTNLTGTVRINAENIPSTGNTSSNNYMYNVFGNTTNPITVQIKQNSTTLTTFNRLTHPSKVTLETFN